MSNKMKNEQNKKWDDSTLNMIGSFVSKTIHENPKTSVAEMAEIFKRKTDIPLTENDFHEIIGINTKRSKIGKKDFSQFDNNVLPKHQFMLNAWFVAECKHPYIAGVRGTHTAPNGKRYTADLVHSNTRIDQYELTIDTLRKFVGVALRGIPLNKYSFDYLENRVVQKSLRIDAITSFTDNVDKKKQIFDKIMVTGVAECSHIPSASFAELLSSELFGGVGVRGILTDTGNIVHGKVESGQIVVLRKKHNPTKFISLTLLDL